MIVDRFSLYEEDEEEDEISFPSFDVAGYFDRIKDNSVCPRAGTLCAVLPSFNSLPDVTVLLKPTRTAADDTVIRLEPQGHVDYLSHSWSEEDLWSSWRYIATQQKVHSNRARLENASWRAWMKVKCGLKTVSPDSLDWRKDSDVTWLYGPLQKSRSCGDVREATPSSSESRMSKPYGFLAQRPILKKRSLAQILLQRSLDAHAIQQLSPDNLRALGSDLASSVSTPDLLASLSKTYSDASLCTSSPGVQTPRSAEKRRIQFNDSVEQCIALEYIDEVEDTEVSCAVYDEEDYDDSSDDDVTSLSLSASSLISRTFSDQSKSGVTHRTIASLPSTMLKDYEGSRRPQLNRGKPFQKTETTLSPPPPKVPTPSVHSLQKVANSYKIDIRWQNDAVDIPEVPFTTYDAIKAQPPPYGTCMHYDEDEHALLLELGCV